MTTSLRAFSRLLWRPSGLLYLVFVLFALGWSVVVGAGRFGDDASLRSPQVVASVFWTMSVTLMAALGCTFEVLSGQAHQSLFAYGVPSLRASIFRGRLIIGCLFALGIATGVLVTDGLMASIGALACAALFFEIGLSIPDRSMPRSWKNGMSVLCVGAAFQAYRLQPLFHAIPFMVTAASLAGAILLFRRETSMNAARSRALFQPLPAGYPLSGGFRRAYDRNANFQSSHWHGLPSTGRLADWIRVTAYEPFGSRRFGYAGWMAAAVAWNCGMSYFLGLNGFAAMYGMMTIFMLGHRLVGSTLYPVSRKRLSEIMFIGGVADAATYFIFAAALSALLSRSGLPNLARVLGGPRDPRDVGLLGFAAAFSLAPIALWVGATRRRGAGGVKINWGAGQIILGFTAIFGEMIVWVTLSRSHLTPTATGAIILVLGIVMYTAYWWLLRRHFATRDLV